MSALLPELTPGVVASINRTAKQPSACAAIPEDTIEASRLNRAMLFEIAVAIGEQLLLGATVDWLRAVAVASARQRRHFDARVPDEIADEDKVVAMLVGNNLVRMLETAAAEANAGQIISAPFIPGLRWISSTTGDFAVGNDLIEVKCANRHFSSADYRQLVMYWILSYASSIEGKGEEWVSGILINPRLCIMLRLRFDDLLNLIASGTSKVELLEGFYALVGSDRELIDLPRI